MTEQNTFNRLRRRDIGSVLIDLDNFMRQIIRRDNLVEIDARHPEVKSWLDHEGYSSKELQDYLRHRTEELRKRIEQMERDGAFG